VCTGRYAFPRCRSCASAANTYAHCDPDIDAFIDEQCLTFSDTVAFCFSHRWHYPVGVAFSHAVNVFDAVSVGVTYGNAFANT